MTTLEAEIESGTPIIRCAGLVGSATKAYLLAKLIQNGPKKTYLVLAGDAKEAATLGQDLEFFLGPLAETELSLFPAHDALPFSSLSSHPDILCERVKTLWALKQKTPPSIIITTPPALLEPLLPKEYLISRVLTVGEEVAREEFIKTLPTWGYQASSVVTELGNYTVRGGLIDIYCPLYAQPLRIEWVGDAIESIRSFDPRTQTSSQKMESSELIPVREVLLGEEQRNYFAAQLRARGEERDIPKPVWGPLIEKVKGGIPFPGIETYLCCFYPNTSRLIDWLPQDSYLIHGDRRQLLRDLNNFWEEIVSLHTNQPLTADEVRSPPEIALQQLDRQKRIEWEEEITGTGAMVFPIETHEGLRPAIEQARRTPHPLKPLVDRLQEWLETDQLAIVVSSLGQAERLIDLLQPFSIPITTTHHFAESQPSGSLTLITGSLSCGFRFNNGARHINIITEEEIFGTKIHRFESKKKSVFDLASLSTLKTGDPVVHRQHGICLYQGLVHLNIDGIANDFVHLQFRDGDKLYLPVYRMNLITRYAGGDAHPRLDKLGGTSWETVKKKAQKAIQEMAGELLNLYAARMAGKGFSFSPANEIFEAFEASFPFEETPDQERAIHEVLKDMESARPMDRLVLGDVGYGKTEVAMRAAFKAVSDNKQVAVLVPTTLLAFQHFERFQERFKNYPVTIDMISRFRSPAEQKATLKKVAEKKVDILIGTHRLLQPDVSFQDLGLLVVDEEHRFGVTHKERIKKMRKDVDVLTLSATPIPRTLHMSMVGLRPISIIETPPTDRLAIRTFVLRFEPEVIREAILREIKRGGQVFFVHNQIETIQEMRERLHELLPEIKTEVAHGQMDEEQLEQIMIRFSHHEFDLLLCTTIIESGIDISTANTILINKAERLGLAQIYQLRGRVGRAGQRAYAYLIMSSDESLTAEATQRLTALQRFAELGSGFRLASYDLEIRGAGALLGDKQSGHVAALGFELYTEIFEETIRQLKGEKILEGIEPELHFRLPAYIPEDYVNEPSIRLELYRRLASLEGEEAIDPIVNELDDRFGPRPPEVNHLLEISVLKTHAKRLRIKQIRFDGKTFVYAFDVNSPLSPEFLLERMKRSPKKYRLTPDHRFIVHETHERPEAGLAAAKKLLRELGLHV